MERPLTREDLEAVQRLVLVQIEALVAPDTPGDLHHPFTRRDVSEWLATAWAISLHVAPPAGFSREDLAWELPGWVSDLDLRTLPARTFPGSSVQPLRASDHVQRIAAIACSMIDQLEPRDLPVDPPRLLLPALLLSTADWKLKPAHLKLLAGSWEEIFLASAIDQCPADQRALVAARVWRLIAGSYAKDGAVPVATRIDALTQRYRSLEPSVLAGIADVELADTRAHTASTSPVEAPGRS